MIKVYGFESCGWCHKTRRFLESKGIEYEYHDIELNPEDAAACEKLTGDTAVPVITVDDKNYVLGFDKAKIEALIGI